MSRRFNIIVTVVISVIFLGLTAIFWQSYVRFGETCKDFGLSAVYYVCELFGIDYSFTPTVTEYSGVLQWEILLPDDWDGFTASAKEYFARLIVPQAVERDILAPTIEQKPADRYDAPPREVAEYDLQVYKQLAHLHIEVCDVETQHEVEIVRKEARDDGCKVQMKYPKDDPAHPDTFMFRQVFAVG